MTPRTEQKRSAPPLPRTCGAPPPRRRLQLEALEERTLLSNGTLDPTFGTGGLVTYTIPGTTSQAILRDTAIQSDGKIIAVGAQNFTSSNEDFAIVRFNPNGSLDTSFGTNGLVTTDFGFADDARAVAIQPDGKIVVGGQAGTSDFRAQFAVARYNSNGTLDTTFGAAHTGKVVISASGNQNLWALALQSDGKIVIAGDNGTFLLDRFNTDGSLDTTFGTGGQVSTGGLLGSGGQAFTVAVQPDGKIVAAGQTAGGKFAFARYTTSGGLDPTFNGDGNNDGIIITAFSPFHTQSVRSIALQLDGKIVAVGVYNSPTAEIGLMRLNTDGSLDSNFGTGGQVTTNPGGASESAGNSVVVHSDGHIVVAGDSSIPGGDDSLVIQYNPNGTVDTTFGTNGSVVINYAPGGNDDFYGLALQADGEIIAAGSFGQTFTMARLLTLPSPNAGGPYVVAEGTTSVQLNASASTGTGLTYQWDLDGDGIFGETGAAATDGNETGIQPTFTGDMEDGPTTITVALRVTDNQGQSATATANIVVTNVAPSAVSLSASPPAIAESGTTTLSGSFIDPGTLDTHTVILSWGDGSTNTTLNLAAGVLTFSTTHQYLDNPASPATSFTVGATVTDKDGGSASGNTTVAVANVAPTNVALSANAINENATAMLSGSFTDPGTLDTHTVVLSWGDSSPNTTLNLAAGVLTFSATHQYLDNPASPATTFAIGATVTDKDGSSAAGSTMVAVANVAPTNVALSANAINENSTTTLSGSFTDPGTLDTHTVVIAWGDGSPNTPLNLAAGVLTFSATHQYLDNPISPATTFAVGATVTDKDGGSASGSTTVAVANVAPANVVLGVGAINENDVATLSGSFTDPGTLDSHTVVLVWGDGSTNTTLTLTAGVLTFSATHQYLDNPASPATTFAIGATVTDKDGASGSGSTTVAVANVAPTNVALSANAINENDTTTLSGSFTDPGTLDTHTVVLSWGDGSANTTLNLAAGVLTFSTTHQYLDNPAGPATTFAIGATATDKDGASAGSTTVAVANVAPASISVGIGPTIIGESGTTTLSGSFTDPGTLDTHTVVLSWGDGSPNTTLMLAANTLTFNVTHQYLDNPANPATTFAINATVTDKDGGSGSGGTTVAVANVAPTNVALSANAINENDTTTLLGSFADPGTLDTHTVVLIWGDGSANTTLDLAAGVLAFSTTHQYLDNPTSPATTFGINAIVTDKDGGSASGSTTVAVANVAPTNLALSANAINENDTTTLSGSFTDPGTLDTHTVVLSWGDGSPNTTLTLAANVLAFSATHQYLDNPTSPATTFPIGATITDKDGGAASGSTTVAVANVAPANLVLGVSAINENDTTTLLGSFTDPGTLDTHMVVLVWGDGSPSTTLNLAAGVLTFSATHQYLDNPTSPATTFPVGATVTDKDGGSAAGSTTVAVTNVAPANVVLGAGAIDENDVATLSGSFTDPGTLDTHTVILVWGDGSANTTLNLTAGVLTFSATHQYLDNPIGPATTFTVGATVIDKDGTSGSGSTTVAVANVAPTNVALTANAINENGTTMLSGSFADPGTLDTHTVVIAWGDGSANTTLTLTAGVLTFGATHQYLDNPIGPATTFTVGATATDKDGASDSGSTTVAVANVAPTNVALSANAINENGTTMLSGSFADPGTLDMHTVVLSWGDGSPSTTLDLAAGVLTFSTTHQYLDNPVSPAITFAIAATVTDKDGGSAAGGTTAAVANVAPANVVLGAGAITENDVATLSGSFADPGTLDTHTVILSWGDGSANTTLNLTAGALTFSATHQYLDNPASPAATFAINASVTDKDGGSASGSTTIAVANAAPTNVALSAVAISENGTTALLGSFADPGTLDTHTVVLAWGDGSANTTLTLAAGVLTFSATHQYLDNPANPATTFIIGATVTDKDGGSAAGSAKVAVANVAPANVALIAIGINENDTTTLLGSFTDPGTLDTHTVVLAWGDGSPNTIVTLPANVLIFSATHQYLDNPANPVTTFAIGATVTDKDGGSGLGSTTVAVANVAPTTVALSANAINENDTTTLSGSFIDPGTLDTHTVVLNWGDGSANITLTLAAGVLTFSATHQYLDNPASPATTFAINAIVTDKDGGSAAGSTTVAVANVAPTNVALSTNAISENGTTTLLGSFADPGTLDTHTVVIGWDDGSASTILNLAANVLTFIANHQYLDNPDGSGTAFPVSVTVTDKDGGTSTGSTLATVANVAPTITALSLNPIIDRGTVTLTGGFADPGTLDTHTVLIDWGDGSAPTALDLGANVLTFGASHQYLHNPAAGATAFTIGVTITDKDGAAATGSTSATHPLSPSTPGVFDPTTGIWYLSNMDTAASPDIAPFAFGAPGWIPIVGDWDGDGVTTLGVFDPGTATWYLKNGNGPGAPDIAPFHYGEPGWIPVVGDWDGNGTTTIGVVNPATMTWYLKNSNGPGAPDIAPFVYGALGSTPVAGDWDGDGKTSVGVVEAGSVWKLTNATAPGAPSYTFDYGLPGATPVVGDWDGNGTWTPGVLEVQGTVSVWMVRNSNSAGAPSITPFAYGEPGWLPLAGDWSSPGKSLLASAGEGPGASALGAADLNGALAAALARLQQAGVNQALLGRLQTVTAVIQPLPAGTLGEAQPDSNHIVLDDDGAGHGWFVDPTPAQDEEFTAGMAQAGSPALGHEDLLSAVLHEFGDIVGLADESGNGLMANTLAAGTRNLTALDQVFAAATPP